MATLLHRIQKGIYGDNQWYARQTWKLDNSSAEGFAAGRLGLELTTATTSSLYDPLCTKVDIVKNARVKGKALVTETFTAVRKPGTATIVGSIKTASYRKADVDRDGLVISGPVGDGLNLWRPSPAGSNVVGNTSEGIIVKACYAAQDVATWRSWQNKVNSSTMATLGAAPGILLLRGVNYHPIYMGNITRWYADFLFEVTCWKYPDGSLYPWNLVAWAVKCCYLAQSKSVYSGLTETADTVKQNARLDDYQIKSDGTLEATVPVERHLYHEADMSALDSIIIL